MPLASLAELAPADGPKSSARLLASYGFVPRERNPHDFVTLHGALSSRQMEALSARATPPLVAELGHWQSSDFRMCASKEPKRRRIPTSLELNGSPQAISYAPSDTTRVRTVEWTQR